MDKSTKDTIDSIKHRAYLTCLDLRSRRVRARIKRDLRNRLKGTYHETHIVINDSSIVVSSSCDSCYTIARSISYMFAEISNVAD